ncbi:MAG: hypothetical protein ACLFQS_01990 [Bacteroidales bacterium]
MQKFLLLILIILFHVSCNRKPPYQADISDVAEKHIEIKRYEQILFTVDPENILDEIQPHVKDFELFLGDQIFTPQGQQQLYEYITDPFIIEVYEDTQQVWHDLSDAENQLSQAFRYFRYHFPGVPVPVLYSYISGLDFEYPVKYFDGNIIIGLDMFLGKNYDNYEKMGVPVFKRIRFKPEAMPVEVMRVLVEQMFSTQLGNVESLLDFMVAEGKKLYFLDCMYPQWEDSLKISYTAQQMNWALGNEKSVWVYFLENDLLYESDRKSIQKFIGSAPFTAPLSRESAPRIGAFTGWRIVRNYMEKNPDITLSELLNEDDAVKILRLSQYRPR